MGHLAQNCRFREEGGSDGDCHLAGNVVSFLSGIDTILVSNMFYLDLASTKRVVNDMTFFSKFSNLNKTESITIAKKNVKLEMTGVGTVCIKIVSGIIIQMLDVQYAKDILVN